MPQPLVQINSLHHAYQEGDQHHAVLNGVDLGISKGETIALLGRSGSGKSTLLNLISAIDHPVSGSIIINNQKITHLEEPHCTLFRRQHIGFIYQFFHLIPTLTVYENIALVLELNGWAQDKTKSRVLDLLDWVNLTRFKNSFPDKLSGGEQQRVAIARALAHKPLLVLADEPTGNLDAETGQQMLSLIHRLAEKEISTLILVTHSLSVAKTADRIVTLEQGKLYERQGDFAW